MSQKSAHEPEAKVMNAADVWDDAIQLADVLRENLLKPEPMIKVQIPFSLLLSRSKTLVVMNC